MNGRRWLLCTLLATIGGVLACGGEAAPPEGGRATPPPIVEGGVCNTSLNACVDESSILECVDRRWMRLSCIDECGERGRPALGCKGTKNSASCLCGPVTEERPCSEGFTACTGPDSLALCSDSVWSERSCQDLCEELYPGTSSDGCHNAPTATCWCTLEGARCTEFVPYCASSTALLACQGGVIALTDCVTACEGGALGFCTFFGEAEPEGSCACEP